jgi:hypothetical protein
VTKPEDVGLMEQQKAFLRQRCAKNVDQTFLGTRIHISKNVCHNGGLLVWFTRSAPVNVPVGNFWVVFFVQLLSPLWTT